MPTPIDLLLDPATHIMFTMFGGLALWEFIAPGRPLPRVRGWTLRALAAFTLYFLLSSYLPLLWAGTLAPLQLFDLSGWPTWAAVAAGVLAYECGAYWWHRGMHTFTPLWRTFHQMHHSSERLDVVSAFWFSPLDMVTWTLLPGIVLTILGMPPAAATMTILIVTFLPMFQHANAHTALAGVPHEHDTGFWHGASSRVTDMLLLRDVSAPTR